uniref:Uncharacterized protein n=1 Tax=viral metagenome TaxID=1070528 RepID=A0A6C0HZW2_9ZZZZ
MADINLHKERNLHKARGFISILRQCMRRMRAKECLKKYFLKYIYKKRLKKYLKLQLDRKQVKSSYMCRAYDVHYIEHPLHTLIPYEEQNNYISKELRDKYRRGFWSDLEEEQVQVAPPPTYYSGRYFTQDQIDDGAFVYSGRSVTCRYRGMDYCGLFGLGPRGHAYDSCIGWCGSRHDPENEKCHNVEIREAIMTIVLVIKRWIRNKILRKKRRLPLQILHKELFDKYYHSSYVEGTQSIKSGKNAIQVLFYSRFVKGHIMPYL